MPEEYMKQEAIHIAGHKKWKKLVNNPYGFDFAKQYAAKNWSGATLEVPLFIYGVRDNIFHGRYLPPEPHEGVEFVPNETLDLISSILSKVVRLGMLKLLRGT